jgi:hypothetical protein
MSYITDVLNAGWVGSVLGLCGIALAIVFYLRSKVRPRISYQTNNVRLIGGAGALPSEIEVRYRGKKIMHLARTTCVFWNSGNTTIDAASIVEEDPFRIRVVDGEILSVDVIAVSRSVIAITSEIPDMRPEFALIGFKFLDPGDGAVVALLHTSQEEWSFIEGTIKGLPEGYSYRGTLIPTALEPKQINFIQRVSTSTAASVLMAGAALYMTGMGLFFSFPTGILAGLSPGVLRVTCIVCALLYLEMLRRALRDRRRRLPIALRRTISSRKPEGTPVN